MNLTTFDQLGRSARKLAWGGALGAFLLAGASAIGDVHPDAKRLADQRRQALSLFAGPTAVLQGNQLQCGLTNDGNGTCTDIFNSPTGGGGFWPTGSPNQYVFNTGIQFAAIMGSDGGPWANDTVGAFCFDASGLRPSCTAVTNIFNSLNPDDLANWPAEAFVTDEELFQDVLLGRATASQQDSWMQYWDGDPAKLSGRQHPMGITVTSRSLAWNYPSGNESLIYFIFNATNTTAAGTPQGDEFQRLNEAQFFAGDDALPDAGITYNEAYAAFATDMDVGSTATDNYSTAILPFDIGISYHGGFRLPEFEYSPELFFPPFFTDAPGLIGVKYLKSPINPLTSEEVGLTLFSATLRTGVGTLPDPGTDRQLWRYLSGKLSPSQGDVPCNITEEISAPDPADVQRSLCFLTQSAEDTRFFQASGPFTLPPNETATIVVAYIAAATVETMPDGSPSGIAANNASDNANPPGIPSFHPGFPSHRGCEDATASDCDEVIPAAGNPVKTIERGAGWAGYAAGAVPPATFLEGPQGKVDQFDVRVVPLSLLGRALVAQEIFNTKFLLGFAPAQPVFYLVPGNNQVTVVWDRSATESEEGDPFFAVASDTASALFNPNYREFDVEGYRIWRGTQAGNLELLAQFDFADTEFIDTICETVLPDEDIGNPAGPGFAIGEECPDGFSKATPIDNDLVFNNGGPGSSPGAGVVRLAGGNAQPLELTTAVVDDDAGASQPLANTGVPYVFTDETAVNNFTYFYAVSAFDVNSFASGPNSLRSARVTQNTVPRQDAPNIQNAQLIAGLLTSDGTLLNPSAPLPSIHPEDGTFSGPFPPTNGLATSFAPLVPRLLPTFTRAARIDSIVPDEPSAGSCPNGTSALGSCWHLYLTADNNGVLTEQVIDGFTPTWGPFGDPRFTEFRLLSSEVPFDQDALDAFGIPSGAGFATADATFDEAINYSSMEGQMNRRSGGSGVTFRTLHGGSRWFSGPNESVADPTKYIEVGALDGVTEVWAPIHNTPLGPGGAAMAGGGAPCFSYGLAFLGRAADVEFTWGGGTFADVQDITHGTPVIFKPTVQTSYGFLNADANGNGAIDWDDFQYIENISLIFDNAVGIGFCNHAHNPAENILLEASPTLMPVFTDPTVDPSTGPVTPTGTGFGLYVNGERYIFTLEALPADGTVWTLRTYSGAVRVNAASVDTEDPSGYTYQIDGTGTNGLRPPTIAGLNMSFAVEAATNLRGRVDLAQVHTVPDPYLGSSNYDLGPTSKQLMFVNLPEQATIRIYTLTGVLVDVLVHDDITGGGREVWDVRNRNNQFVASGVYFFHVMTPGGEEHVGKFTIINQAGSN
jgi:hypothetical protein